MKYWVTVLTVCLLTDQIIHTVANGFEERTSKDKGPPNVTYINLPSANSYSATGYNNQAIGNYGKSYNPTYGRNYEGGHGPGYGGEYGPSYGGGYGASYGGGYGPRYGGGYGQYYGPGGPGVTYMSYKKPDKKRERFSLKGLPLGAVGGLGLGLGVGAGVGLAKAILLKALFKKKKKEEHYHPSYVYYPAPNYYVSSYPSYRQGQGQGQEHGYGYGSYDYDYPKYPSYQQQYSQYYPSIQYSGDYSDLKPKTLGFDIGLHGSVPDIIGTLKGR